MWHLKLYLVFCQEKTVSGVVGASKDAMYFVPAAVGEQSLYSVETWDSDLFYTSYDSLGGVFFTLSRVAKPHDDSCGVSIVCMFSISIRGEWLPNNFLFFFDPLTYSVGLHVHVIFIVKATGN